jgi:hypothetical protein
MRQDEVMPQTSTPDTWTLEGAYAEKDLRAFAAFLAGRVAGTKLWALGVFMLLPLYWWGNFRHSWPWLVPIALVIIGFVILLRFRILPDRLYHSAVQLPGVFAPRRITIDAQQVANASEAGGHTFHLEDVQEVITTPEHLFVMVTPKQGIPIPISWIGDLDRVSLLRERLLSRRISKS